MIRCERCPAVGTIWLGGDNGYLCRACARTERDAALDEMSAIAQAAEEQYGTQVMAHIGAEVAA